MYQGNSKRTLLEVVVLLVRLSASTIPRTGWHPPARNAVASLSGDRGDELPSTTLAKGGYAAPKPATDAIEGGVASLFTNSLSQKDLHLPCTDRSLRAKDPPGVASAAWSVPAILSPEVT